MAIRDLARQDRSEPQRAQHLVEADAARWQEAMAGGNLLGQKFGELTELDERRGWVVEEITLGKRAEPRQPLLLCGEEIKVTESPHWVRTTTLRCQHKELSPCRPTTFLL
ncbi:hypothetical protein ACTGJ9_006105 [Bradyrhizobium sp. RDM12]